jgi:hypothetical protein
MALGIDDIRRFVPLDHGLAIVSVGLPSGGVASSLVNAGVLDHPATGEPVVGFVVRGDSRKLVHLRRDARATAAWRAGWRWIAASGPVELVGPDDPGLGLSPDERATLANMATECSAKAGVVEADELTLAWIAARRPGLSLQAIRGRVVVPDPGAVYHGGVHIIELGDIRPMVATPGDPDRGLPSDPTNGAFIDELPEVTIDIAYGGSCTAGKEVDLDLYARVMSEALAAGRKVKDGVAFFIQFGSASVEEYARSRGYVEVFEKTGVTLIRPGCGACIGCGPGVSERPEQVTVSAINRNYQNRSGPGRLYLASPLTVAASANPAVTSGSSVLSIPTGNPADTTYTASSSGLTSVSCIVKK